MEQQLGSGEAIHDSSRGGDLFTFLYNFINQSAELQGTSTQSGILTSPPNIVVTANIAENIVQNIQNIDPALQGSLLDNHLTDFPIPQEKVTLSAGCSCSTEGSVGRQEDTAIGSSISGYQLNNNNNSKEDYIDHSNICKTINDINNNQQRSETFPASSTMPQTSGHTIPNITVPASAAEFLQAPIPPTTLIDPAQNFPIQNWSMDGATNAMNLPEVYATSGLHYPSSDMNQTAISGYPNNGLDQSYLHGVIGNTGFVPQPQFNLHRTNQINHMLQNSLPIQELNSALLRQDNVSVSRSQEIPAMSSAYGMNAYHESLPYNTNNKVTHAQNGNHQVGVGYENFNNSTSVGVLRHSSSGRKSSRQESGSDESLVEDRRGEKKLTSTPIPSDVEKTSSVSSGSHEESPSPEVEVGKPQDQNKTTCTESSYSNIEHQNGSPGFNGDCANSIPVPENVVEIDQDTVESPVVENGTCSSQPALKTSSTMKIFPQNSASAHKIPQASWPLPKAHTVVEATNSAKTKERMANDSKESWSVRKEERRKRRLHKKRLKAKQQIQNDSSDYQALDRLEQHNIATDNYSGHESQQSGASNQHRKHLRQSDWDKTGKSSSDLHNSQTEHFPTAYRDLVPKATADPTSSANILAKTNHLQEGHRKDFRKHRQSEKKRSKIRMKSLMNSNTSAGNISITQKVNGTQENRAIHSSSMSSEIIKPAVINPRNPPTNGENVHNSSGNASTSAGVRRWQTVTAVQGPKLPPMLSERDRIPKRGRPSKKMTEQNLKLKAEVSEAAKKKVKIDIPKAPVAPSTSSNLVSLYTINDEGFIQEIENKPKESKRSKERAEAFLSMLSEISRKSTIQTKTPSAKDAVGAFKAVGVRTRKQVSTGSSAEKKKSRSKVFGGQSNSNTTKEQFKSVECMNEHGVYTFSELAKQYKISNSILYRAMEQSQRGQKTKSSKSKQEQTHRSSKLQNKFEDKIETMDTVKSASNYKDEIEDKLTTIEKASTSSTSQFSSESGSLKPISLSSEKATELSEVEIPSPREIQKQKKKKKKKKHKKERDEDGKRKKKDKKKKSKHKHKRSREASDSVFTSGEINNNLTHDAIIGEHQNFSQTAKPTHLPKSAASLTTKKHKDITHPEASSNSVSTPPKRKRSLSSLSGLDEDQAYDAGDSSSDADVTKQTSVKGTKAKPISSTPLASSVFGSSVSSIMPSFQAIKEHGGLLQLSEHTKKLEEGQESVLKKHKHKRKKLVRRTKSISDPKFLCNMEELVKTLQRTKISEAKSFLSASMASKSNIFAKKPGLFTGLPNQHNLFTGDAFSYRDPSKNHSKSKSQSFSKPTVEAGESSLKFGKPDLYKNYSAFCRSNFFQMHGLVKKHTGPPLRSFLGDINSNNEQTCAFTTTNTTYRNEPLPSKFTSSENSEMGRTVGEVYKDDDDSGSLKKGAKRKRGWPLGRPRGPRSKKSNLDIGEIQPTASANFTPKSSKSIFGSTSRIGGETKLFINPTTTQTKDENNMLQTKTSSKTENAKDIKAANNLASTDPQAPFSHDLVSHIKAVITKTLNKSELSSEIVSKTVDIAVADYLQNKQSTDDVRQDKTSKPDNGPSAKKPRGRPPKKDKTGKDLNELHTANGEKAAKKTALIKPIAIDNDSLDSNLELLKPKQKSSKFTKKRGPGRPRKNTDLTDGNASKKTLKSVRTKQSVNRTRRSVNMETVTKMPKQNTSQNSKTNASKAKTHRASTSKAAEIALRDGSISCQKAKVAVGACLSYKALQQQSQSPSWVRSLNSPPPGLYDGLKADKHMDDAIEQTISKCSQPTSSTTYTRTIHTHKLTVKKSLESVVAKLKKKQSSVDNSTEDMIGNFNTNNNAVKFEEMQEEASIVKQVGNRKVSNESEASSLSDDANQNDLYGESMDSIIMQSRKHNLSSSSTVGISRTDPQTTSLTLPEERKRFLNAGLFSAQFKITSGEECDPDEDQAELFPSPLHSDNFLLKYRKDFQLPFNIWWMYNQRLITPSQDLATQFTKIDTNVYVDCQPTCEQEEHVCVCQTLSDIHASSTDAQGCGKECLNRLMYIECSPDTCPCGDKCGNRCIQKQLWWPDLERFRTNERGWGIKSNSEIAEGQFLLEYVGEVVSEREFRRRTIENYNAHNDHYCVQLEAGTVIDGYRLANEGRFVNHSCRPNCEMQKWVVNGQYRVGLFSKRSIANGEELTYDYNFHAYNLDRQQPCRCGSAECRGVIGGKTQRGSDQGGKTRGSAHAGKDRRGKSQSCETRLYSASTRARNIAVGSRHYRVEEMPPISEQEKQFVKRSRLFLLRNLSQTKIHHENSQTHQPSSVQADEESLPALDADDTASALLRNAINDVFTAVMTCKDENGVSVAIPFINLPSKSQNPEYYDHVTDPVGLSFVEQKIVTKQYQHFQDFCHDIQRVFRNAEKYHGRKSTLGRDVARLRRAFACARSLAAVSLGLDDDEKKKECTAQQRELDERRKNGDYIRCICGIFKDEGLMIQCEKCYVWQHCDCMSALPEDYNDERAYLCEECDEREFPSQVKVVPQPPSAPPGHTYYLTLMKDELKVKQGDCVRMIHDHRLRQRPASQPAVRASYRLQSHSTPDTMDFFRVKKLWTDDNGDKFAYGHHFLRPHDTRHNEGRLFFHNELIATPFHEIVPLEAIVSICYVMDLETYRLGQPKGVKDEDLYICQRRVDASFRIIERVIKTRYPTCTKPHVFDTYPALLEPLRELLVPEQYRRNALRRTQWLKQTKHGDMKSDEDESSGDEEQSTPVQIDEEELEAMATDDVTAEENPDDRDVKQRRLNGILTKLMKDANTRNLQAST